MPNIKRVVGVLALVSLFVGAPAQAGPVFLTGHDPDFHAQFSAGAQDFLETALDYVMGGTLDDNVHKFLWVESALAPIGGHVTGYNSLPLLGLTLGVDYDVVDAAGLAGADFSDYQAIAVASTFGGMLTSAELNGLIARSADISAFINGGGGLFASAECDASIAGCDGGANLAAPHGPLFGFLPVVVSSVSTVVPYALTPFGSGLGFSASAAGYINECCTHNSFGLVGGLNIVDTDAVGHATTLAGVVRVGDGGFEPVPEPTTMSLLGLGLVGICGRRFRNRSRKARSTAVTTL